MENGRGGDGWEDNADKEAFLMVYDKSSNRLIINIAQMCSSPSGYVPSSSSSCPGRLFKAGATGIGELVRNMRVSRSARP